MNYLIPFCFQIFLSCGHICRKLHNQKSKWYDSIQLAYKSIVIPSMCMENGWIIIWIAHTVVKCEDANRNRIQDRSVGPGSCFFSPGFWSFLFFVLFDWIKAVPSIPQYKAKYVLFICSAGSKGTQEKTKSPQQYPRGQMLNKGANFGIL